MNPLRKTKTAYFQNLNIRDLSDNRKFWKTIKPYFTNKGLNSNKLLLKEKGNTLEDVLNAFNSHPSIERIRRTFKTNEKFSFQPVPENLVREIILSLDAFKATPVGDIPA